MLWIPAPREGACEPCTGTVGGRGIELVNAPARLAVSGLVRCMGYSACHLDWHLAYLTCLRFPLPIGFSFPSGWDSKRLYGRVSCSQHIAVSGCSLKWGMGQIQVLEPFVVLWHMDLAGFALGRAELSSDVEVLSPVGC